MENKISIATPGEKDFENINNDISIYQEERDDIFGYTTNFPTKSLFDINMPSLHLTPYELALISFEDKCNEFLIYRNALENAALEDELVYFFTMILSVPKILDALFEEPCRYYPSTFGEICETRMNLESVDDDKRGGEFLEIVTRMPGATGGHVILQVCRASRAVIQEMKEMTAFDDGAMNMLTRISELCENIYNEMSPLYNRVTDFPFM